jgi:CopG family nickel-responsive transcriptional regulator
LNSETDEKVEGKEKVSRISMSLPEDLLNDFDDTSKKKGYLKRSEAIRDALRNFILESKWTTDEDAIVAGTISLVYDHEVRSLVDRLTDIEHDSGVLIKASLHLHLDVHNCMEIIAMEGKAKELKKLSEAILGNRGVETLKTTVLHSRKPSD